MPLAKQLLEQRSQDRATPDKPPGQDAKGKKAAAEKRKAAASATTAARTKPSDGATSLAKRALG
jgi:hypothetical protein